MSDIKAFLFDDDRGVSPVIGVILMVAITVILAAVIASFVLGLGDTSESAPNVNFDYELDDGSGTSPNTLTITHQSGETIDNSTIEFVGPTSGNSDDWNNPSSVSAGGFNTT